MYIERFPRPRLVLICASLLLASCGGGGGGKDATSMAAPAAATGPQNTTAPSISATALEPAAPPATGNTATDGFNWFNFRRTQAGLAVVSANTTVDVAAQGHSDYQARWGISHYQTEGNAGFTGVCLYDNIHDPQCQPAKVSRLEAAGFQFTNGSYAFGEVISAMSDPSGANAAEGLIGAIYHRFVILEPMFRQAGVGKAIDPRGGVTYFTTNFVTDGLDIACADRGRVVTYPFAGQQQVQRNFMSDSELPDPVPDRNEVGYPVSIHADIIARLSVQSFTVQPSGGAPLDVRPLTSTTDPEHTPSTAAAVVPLAVLAPNTTYEARFAGTVEYGATATCPALSLPINRTWSFTTRS